MRWKLKPIIFVLNNQGYTIERFLNGMHRSGPSLFDITRPHCYLESIMTCLTGIVQNLRNFQSAQLIHRQWTALLPALGDIDGSLSESHTVRNKQELSALLDNEKFARADKMRLVELIMDKFDAPRALKVQAELSGKTNAYVSTEASMTGTIPNL